MRNAFVWMGWKRFPNCAWSFFHHKCLLTTNEFTILFSDICQWWQFPAANILPTAGEGNVFTRVCLSTLEGMPNSAYWECSYFCLLGSCTYFCLWGVWLLGGVPTGGVCLLGSVCVSTRRGVSTGEGVCLMQIPLPNKWHLVAATATVDTHPIVMYSCYSLKPGARFNRTVSWAKYTIGGSCNGVGGNQLHFLQFIFMGFSEILAKNVVRPSPSIKFRVPTFSDWQKSIFSWYFQVLK